jgi:hypothetical protein
VDDSSELEQALEACLASGPVEVFEDGKRVAGLSSPRYELHRQGQRLLLHLWSEESNLVRRVLGIERQPDGIRLAVERFGKAAPGRLEIVLLGAARPAARLSREKFCAHFGQLLAGQFPDESLHALTTAPDLERSFSGCYSRGVLRRGRRAWAVFAVSPGEDAATVDGALGFALLWLDWTRQQGEVGVEGLRLFLPPGMSQMTRHRLQALRPGMRPELYAWQPSEPRAERLDPGDIGNVATWLTPRREVEETLEAAGDLDRKIRALAPEAIDEVVPPGTREVAWRFRGLEFARYRGGRAAFGLAEERRELTSSNWPALARLVRDLSLHRNALASDRNHAYYRAAAERWLESLVLADPARVDAHFDARTIYPQVPAFSAGDRGVIDLLAATREGRLAVLELKVSEDIQMLLQAVDYWLRVRWHHREGDFPRYGYFVGRELLAADPLLYLVAPGLRFHPATEVLLRYLSPEIPVFRVGLNENWRKEIRVTYRQ